MKPKFRAPSGPRTPDYAPAARRILFLSLLLLFLLLTMGNLQKSREALADRIAPSILRFHILANSDSREDQAVKLEVRSFLLDYIQDRLPEHVDSKEAVITWLSENKRNLETAATRFLTKKQMPYSARLSLEQAWFPTRVYDNLVIPCGTYDAARVILGEGNGHNWWCVLFPSLCFENATTATVPDESKAKLKNSLTREEYDSLEKPQHTKNDGKNTADVKIRCGIYDVFTNN